MTSPAAEDFEEIVPLPAFRMAGSWLVGATTFAMDRAVPQVELIYRPGGDYVGGTMTVTLERRPVTVPAIVPASRKRRLMARLKPPAPVDLGDTIFYDTRSNTYFNWAHQINTFLTIALYLRARIGTPILILLPEGMAPAAIELHRRFGFEVLLSDAAVTGRQVRAGLSNEEALISRRPEMIAAFMAEHDRDERIFPHSPELPQKVFLARRGNRAIVNEREIEALLAKRGYTKVYAEDHSVPEQFALLRQATHLVAVHGAALAPLQFRSPDAPPLHFVEICPVGHMTRCFEIISQQHGGSYCAVRGQMKPEHVEKLYAKGPFLAHSNDDFTLDPYSLRVALAIEATGRIIEDLPSAWPLEA